jgi:hypothetical protein
VSRIRLLQVAELLADVVERSPGSYLRGVVSSVLEDEQFTRAGDLLRGALDPMLFCGKSSEDREAIRRGVDDELDRLWELFNELPTTLSTTSMELQRRYGLSSSPTVEFIPQRE